MSSQGKVKTREKKTCGKNGSRGSHRNGQEKKTTWRNNATCFGSFKMPTFFIIIDKLVREQQGYSRLASGNSKQ